MVGLLDALLAPVLCAGCGVPGSLWCTRCSAHPTRVLWRQCGIPVLSAYRFEGPIRRTIIDWKDEDSALASDRVAGWFERWLTALTAAMPDAVVVPIPSSPAANRHRGRDALLDVLSCVGAVPWLAPTRSRDDQAGLGRAARVRNLHGSMRWDGPPGRAVIVVDDVITTGSTMREAARALVAGGCREAVGFALASREHSNPVVDSSSGLC